MSDSEPDLASAARAACDAWEKHWDCSGSPGHEAVHDAIYKLRDALAAQAGRGEPYGWAVVNTDSGRHDGNLYYSLEGAESVAGQKTHAGLGLYEAVALFRHREPVEAPKGEVIAWVCLWDGDRIGPPFLSRDECARQVPELEAEGYRPITLAPLYLGAPPAEAAARAGGGEA